MTLLHRDGDRLERLEAYLLSSLWSLVVVALLGPPAAVVVEAAAVQAAT